MKFKYLIILLLLLLIIPVSFADSQSDENSFDNTTCSTSYSEVVKKDYNNSYYGNNNKSIKGPDLDSEYTNFKMQISEKNTYYVNSSYKGLEETGTINNPFKTVKSAFSSFSVSRGITNIYIANGVYSITNTVSLTKNLNIIGESSENTILDGNNASQLFSIKPNNIQLNIFNLTLTHGTSYYGGAIYNNQSSVNLVNTIFKENYAEGSNTINNNYSGAGGAIYNDAGILKIYNSSFINNKAISSLTTYGGAIYNELGTVSILNSKFINNVVENTTYGSGGAIYNFNGFLTLFNSLFSNNIINSTYSIGGALYNCEAHNVFVINSTFNKNEIYGNYSIGSAIANKAVLLEVVNSTISNNYADGISLENSTIYNINGFYNFINSTMTNNTIKNQINNPLICLEDQLIISQAFDDDLLINLPSKYDLRLENLVTSVKSQGSSGACWAFTTLAALESYLLKYENITYDFSENNMKNIMNSYSENGTDWSDGGNYQMGIAYLLRWEGPVSENDDSFSSYSIIPNYDLNSTKHVQDVIFIPLRMDYLDVNQIKYAIMKYGALYTSIYGTNMLKSVYNSIPVIPNHAVAIVGWDDNYPASRFSGTKPPGNGAFIIKNSWSTSYGERGYGYVSYYDTSFAGYGLDSISTMAFVNVENNTNYKDIYQYDLLGNTYESLGYNSNTGWLANKFTSNSNNPLSAFGVYTYGNSDYLINIYVNDELKYSQKGIINYAGYHTIKLNELVNLTQGDEFRLNLRLTTYDSLFPIAIESYREGYSSKATASLNQSFVSFDGENWYDIAKNTEIIKFSTSLYNNTLKNTNVCLKAYTANVGNLTLNISSNLTYFIENDMINISINISNIGDYVKDINVTLNLDKLIELESFEISKGELDKNISIWHINSLNKNENAILNLIFSVCEMKDIESIITVNSQDNTNITIPFNLYYSNQTKFITRDIITLSKSNDKINITLLDMANRPLTNKKVIINDNTTLITNENGLIFINLDLVKGNYTYNLYFKGDEKYSSNYSTFNVNVIKRNSTLTYTGSNTLYYPNNISISLLDENLQVLANKTVELNIYDSKGYLTTTNYITNSNGSIKLSSLKAGKYRVSCIFKNDSLYEDTKLDINISIIKKDVKIICKNMIMTAVVIKLDGKIGKYFKFTLTDEKNKVLSDKKIKIIFNGKTYDKITDKKGIASLQINVGKSGIYNLRISYSGDEEYKSITKIAKITIKKKKTLLTIKNTHYKTTKVKITAILKNNNKKPISSKKIKFKINNKKYSAKTNAKGKATIKVKLSAKKSYTVNVSFSGDKTYLKTSKKQKLLLNK